LTAFSKRLISVADNSPTMDESNGLEGPLKIHRVVIVDDHPIMRKGVRHALALRPGFQVVGEFGNLTDALEAIGHLQPDAVILDLVLGGRDGVDVVSEIRRVSGEIRILVYSMNPEELFALLALKSGANGYLMKSTGGFEELHCALERILGGGTYLSSHMATLASGGHLAGDMQNLTAREMQVFLRLGEGKTTSEIAHEMHLSVKTVFAHRDRLKEKLMVKSGAELVRRAIVHVLRQGGPPSGF